MRFCLYLRAAFPCLLKYIYWNGSGYKSTGRTVEDTYPNLMRPTIADCNRLRDLQSSKPGLHVGAEACKTVLLSDSALSYLSMDKLVANGNGSKFR